MPPEEPDLAEALGEAPANAAPETATRSARRPGRKAGPGGAAPGGAAESAVEREKPPRDLVSLWPIVIAKARNEYGCGPDNITMSGQRIALGAANRQEAVAMPTIRGDSVMGAGFPDYEGAGEDLVEYITQVWHIAAGVETSARYRVRFYVRGNKGSFEYCDLTLAPAKELKQQRAVAENMRPDHAARMGSVDVPAYRPQPRYPQASAPQYAPVQAPAPMPVPAAIPGASPELEQARLEMARNSGRYEELLRREGLAASHPAPVAPSQEEQDARTVRLIAQTLQSMGITGPMAPAPAAPPPAPPTPAQVDGQAKDPLDAMERVLDHMDRLRAFDARLAKRYQKPEEEEEPEPEPAPAPTVAGVPMPDPFKLKPIPIVKYRGVDVMFRSKRDDEEWGNYLLELGMSNPTMAKDIASRVLDESQLGQLVAKLAGLAADKRAIPTAGESVPANGAAAATPTPAAQQSWTPKA